MVQPRTYDRQGTVDAALQHLPARLRPTIDQLLAQWPGRVMWGSGAAFARVELFDRAMAVAAQFFTSVFPTVIMVATFLEGGKQLLSDELALPGQSSSLLTEAFSDSSSATFGVLGALVVLAAATSLSRALTRAYAATWMLPRPQTRLNGAWRWLAVVLVFALAVVLVPVLMRYVKEIPPATFWRLVTGLALDGALAVFVPWILLSGRVHPRWLAAGGVLFAAAMAFVRPASARWLPQALEASAERYGTFGVAFTYLAWLYVISWCLLATSAVGQVVTTDEGWFGGLLRGERNTDLPGTASRGARPSGRGEAGASPGGTQPLHPPQPSDEQPSSSTVTIDNDGHGPIEFLILEFPRGQFIGDAGNLKDLVERGVIRLHDLTVVSKDQDGRVEILEVPDQHPGMEGVAFFANSRSALISDLDLEEAAAAMAPDTVAALIIYENSGAIRS